MADSCRALASLARLDSRLTNHFGKEPNQCCAMPTKVGSMGMTDREYRAWERQQREKYRKGLQALLLPFDEYGWDLASRGGRKGKGFGPASIPAD